MTQILNLPALPPGTARFWSALACRLLPVSLTLDNGQATAPQVRLTCHVAGGEAVFADDGVVFTLYVNLNGLWRVEFGNLDVLALRPELDEWLRADTGNRFALLPEGLVRAVLERLFLPVLDNLSRHTGLPALFVGPPRATVRPMFLEHLGVLLRVAGDKPISTPLRIAWQDAATLAPVVDCLEALPLLPPPLALSEADIAADIVMGSMRLTPGELASLRQGDVLLPPVLQPGEPCLRLAYGPRLACTLAGSILTVRALVSPDGSATHGEHAMSDTIAENAAPLLGQDALETLELDVTFELPGLRLPLAECSRIAPGYTFTLPADVANLPVTVRAGGCAVARGRLVDVGGTVGVQVTQLSGDSRGNTKGHD